MKLIVGLGNPGAQYSQTRHNVGFTVVERLAARHGLSGAKSRFHGEFVYGPMAGQKCLLLRPTTYMNRSGLAVAEAVHFYQLDPGVDLLVVVDDVALPCGRLRLRGSGGTGGHNGLADVTRALGTENYARLRIGVDSPGHICATDYVLGKFTAAQFEIMQDVLDTACDAVACWIAEGIDRAMNKFNTPD